MVCKSLLKINHVFFFFLIYFFDSIFCAAMEAAVHAEQADFLSAERLNYLLEVLNNGSTSEDRSSSTNYNEQER